MPFTPNLSQDAVTNLDRRRGQGDVGTYTNPDTTLEAKKPWLSGDGTHKAIPFGQPTGAGNYARRHWNGNKWEYSYTEQPHPKHDGPQHAATKVADHTVKLPEGRDFSQVNPEDAHKAAVRQHTNGLREGHAFDKIAPGPQAPQAPAQAAPVAPQPPQQVQKALGPPKPEIVNPPHFQEKAAQANKKMEKISATKQAVSMFSKAKDEDPAIKELLKFEKEEHDGHIPSVREEKDECTDKSMAAGYELLKALTSKSGLITGRPTDADPVRRATMVHVTRDHVLQQPVTQHGTAPEYDRCLTHGLPYRKSMTCGLCDINKSTTCKTCGALMDKRQGGAYGCKVHG